MGEASEDLWRVATGRHRRETRERKKKKNKQQWQGKREGKRTSSSLSVYLSTVYLSL